jgi:hypothetical protein
MSMQHQPIRKTRSSPSKLHRITSRAVAVEEAGDLNEVAEKAIKKIEDVQSLEVKTRTDQGHNYNLGFCAKMRHNKP